MMYILKNKNILILIGIVLVAVAGYFVFGTLNSDPETLAKELKSSCDSKNTEQCYYQEFRKAGKDKGAKYSFEILAALQEIDSDAQGCHLLAHGIGSGAYERDPKNWQELINTINPSCSYGAPHGVIENYLASSPDRRLTKELIPQICGPTPRADCNHIIGHLTLVETRANVDEALSLCGVFTDDRQREFCLTGVFMEYQTALNLIEHGYAPRSWLNWPSRVPELEKMCREQTGENAVACWKEIVHAALAKFHNDPQKIFDFCNTAQVAQGAKECKEHSIGIIAAGAHFDLDNIKSMCQIPQKNEPNFERECYLHLVSSTLSTIPQAKDKVNAYCRSLNTKYLADCLSRASSSIRYISND